MTWFTKEFITFFKELEKNNDREWFAVNKPLYEKAVKIPFEQFVTDLIAALSKEDKRLAVDPKKAIFRIYKDTRFSKDKTPYKVHASAAISAGGRKSTSEIGVYIELGAKHLGIAGGLYSPEKEQIEDVRAEIALDPKGWKKALNEKSFKSMWGGVQGERNKILPPDYKALMTEVPEIANKQFYYWVELPVSMITSEDLVKTIVKHYKASASVRSFLWKALN